MIPSLDPVDLLREAWRRSRLLRVVAIAGLLGLALLVVITLLGKVAPGLALMLSIFDLGVWYFALATARAFAEHRRWSDRPFSRRLEEAAALLALLTIGLSQGLFLVMVLRLASSPTG